MRRNLFCIATALLVVAGFAPRLNAAVTYGFTRITSNGAPATPTDQYIVEVSSDVLGNVVTTSNQAVFTFRNQSVTGSVQSFIDGVYFDDGSLLEISNVINGSGVDFSQGGSPPDLPGGELLTPAFETSAGFLADRDGGASNGVDIGEFVQIVFSLKTGKTLANILFELNNPTLPAPELRIGLKLQGYPGGQSETYVNSGVLGDDLGVPEPTTLSLWMLSGIAVFGRRFIRRRSAT